MGGSDRALMLALPGLAVLAAFALPTMRRSVTAAIDWFSVFFFTVCAIAIWVIYMAMQTGVPAKPLANVMKLAPGFEPQFSMVALAIAAAGTAAWLALVRWRTGRHQHALWKSLVLPAAGVVLCWLLLMTLWLPLLDYARSYRALGGAGGPARAGRRLHRGAGPRAGPHRRARVLRRLGGGRPRQLAAGSLRFPAGAGQPRAALPRCGPDGNTWAASAAPPTGTGRPASFAAGAESGRERGHGRSAHARRREDQPEA